MEKKIKIALVGLLLALSGCDTNSIASSTVEPAASSEAEPTTSSVAESVVSSEAPVVSSEEPSSEAPVVSSEEPVVSSEVSSEEHVHTYSDEWSKDADYHWHAATCEHTDLVSDKAEHTWDTGTVVTTKDCKTKEVVRYTCTVCGQTKDVEGELGDHKWSETYEHDDTQHWHKCSVDGCDAISEKTDHVWGDGEVTKAASYTEEGEITYTCVCGATKKETTHKLEQNVKPEALTNAGDYALETFGDTTENKIFTDSNGIVYSEELSSFAFKYETDNSTENYFNFATDYLDSGLYYLDFDYYVLKTGSGFFYVALWCNDTQADCAEIRVDASTAATKLHARIDANFLGKTRDKAFIKMHAWGGTQRLELFLDNIKLTKRGAPAYEEPLYADSVDGGTFGYNYSETLGCEAFNFVTNGTAQYEKVYLKATNVIEAGKYTLSFDYSFIAYNTNEMWFAVYQESNPGTAVTEVRLTGNQVGTKYSQELTFVLDSRFLLIRIMTSNVAGVINMALNHFVFEAAPADEPVTKLDSLTNVGDAVIETFGDPTSSVLSYSNAKYDKTIGSYVSCISLAPSNEIYYNFDKVYTTNGVYTLEFDYWMTAGNFFYVALWCNGVQADAPEMQVTDVSVGEKHHFTMQCDFTGKTVTTNFMKIHNWQGVQTDFVIDNVKLSKA